MRYLLCCFILLSVLSCNEKKSDVALFDEGKTRITLTADPTHGYEPLDVSFEAYLENRERVLTKEITDVTWIVQGPNRFFREIKQGSYDYQNEDGNENDAFYLDYNFYNFGRYTVKLVLNEGEYVSNPMTVRVLERETEHRYKPRY